ncbi:hypothetical protein HYY69_01550 [Candidatus Woesearchaeota archaeon]|nr:hypothetical protein [Candidatus Woesearchaeota archaeon]
MAGSFFNQAQRWKNLEAEVDNAPAPVLEQSGTDSPKLGFFGRMFLRRLNARADKPSPPTKSPLPTFGGSGQGNYGNDIGSAARTTRVRSHHAHEEEPMEEFSHTIGYLTDEVLKDYRLNHEISVIPEGIKPVHRLGIVDTIYRNGVSYRTELNTNKDTGKMTLYVYGVIKDQKLIPIYSEQSKGQELTSVAVHETYKQVPQSLREAVTAYLLETLQAKGMNGIQPSQVKYISLRRT